MKIAAQLSGIDLQIFIEESGWMRTTLPLNKEMVKVELAVMNDKGIYHDALHKAEPDTHPSLMFCRALLTLSDFKHNLKRAGYGEPYEVRLSARLFTLKKEFTDAYTLTFPDYRNNQAFTRWLASIPTLESGFLLQRLREGRRYCSRGFSEFRDFKDLKQFTEHRFGLWHDAIVKDYEDALANGSARCNGCEDST